MTDHPEDDPNETPIQRALRMKKAALQAKPRGQQSGFKPGQSARMPTGASKPWLKK